MAFTLSSLAGQAATAPPATDPAVLPADRVNLVPGVVGTHPRLLFNAAELTGLRTAIGQAPLQAHYTRLLNYLGSSVVPGNTNFLTDATEAQRQGLWRMPTVALHYALTGSQTSFNRTKAFMDLLLSLPNWDTTVEFDSGMGAGNMMVGAALAYDWLYNDLTPAYREQFRQALLYHARAMYYLGHLKGNGSNPYWQGDPANNHRFHRDAGLALAMLAASEGNPAEDWILKQTYDELSYVAQWLPDDGSCHEGSGYLVFGGSHLALAMDAADRCFGTSYLHRPFFQNTARFRAQLMTPGLGDFFKFGDASDGAGGYNHFTMLASSRNAQPDVQAAMDSLFQAIPSAFDYGWFGVVWHGPDLAGGDIANLAKAEYFPDLGLTFHRDSWAVGGAGGMFKCGPFGGQRLNEYRNANGYLYLNVAHDDPDANSFTLFRGGKSVAETSRYSYAKKSANHNTILVDGKGQRANGRAEGLQWTQPATGATDMNKMAFVTQEIDHGDVVLTEGEAEGSYPELSRFRRSFLWVAGRYVLVLDDIRAPVSREITWLMQSGTISIDDAGAMKFSLHKTTAACAFQVASSTPLSTTVTTSSADDRGTSLGWQQLQLKATTSNLQVASVYDLWGKGSLQAALTVSGTTSATIVVTGSNGINDTWQWQFAPTANPAVPSVIEWARAPSIYLPPAGQAISVNQTASLKVGQGGLGPVNFQWFQGAPGDTSHPVGGNSTSLGTPVLDRSATFWVRLTNTYGTFDSSAVTVAVTDGYWTWAEGRIPDPAKRDPLIDAELDGKPNLLEYVLALNPLADNSQSPNLPVPRAGAAGLQMDFQTYATGQTDVLLEVQASENLTTAWTTILSRTGNGPWTGPATVELAPPSGGIQKVTVTAPAPLSGSADRRFMRLKVTRLAPPPGS